MVNLVIKAQKGDQEALAELLRTVQSRLMRFCLYLVPDAAEAQDLFQESLIKAFVGIKNLKKPELFMDWLFRVTKNQFLDNCRSRRPEKTEDIHEKADELLMPENPEIRLRIQEAMENLDPDDRLLLLLVDLEGHSYAEAAGIIGLSTDQVRFRLHQARAKFAERYKK